MTLGKSPKKSRTLRFNLLAIVLVALIDQSELLRSLLSPRDYLLLMLTISLVNGYLRFKTSQPLTKRQRK